MKKLSARQIAAMTPETRQRYEARLKTVKRNRKIAAGFCTFLVLAVFLLVLCCTILFNITSITVDKKSKFYSAEQIISASGLNTGDNMVRTDFKKAAQRVTKTLPYIRSVKFGKTASGAVTVSVTDNEAHGIVVVSGGFAVTDADGKVLELLKEKPKNHTLQILKTKGTVKAVIGEVIGFADEDEENLYNSVCAQLKATGLMKNITEIDISNSGDITMVYQNRFRLKLGSAENLEDKLKSAVQTIKLEDEADPRAIGEINLTTPKKAFIKPLESLEEPQTTAAPPVQEGVADAQGSDGETKPDDLRETDENTQVTEDTTEEDVTEETSEE